MDLMQSLDKRNLRQLKLFKRPILIITVLMFLTSIIINDNAEVKMIHLVLIIIIVLLNLSIIKGLFKNRLPIFYIYTLTLWGIFRLGFYPNRIMTHTPLIVIILSISFIYILKISEAYVYYSINYILTGLILIGSLKDPLPYMITYLFIYLFSFYINYNNYQNFIRNEKNTQTLLAYEDKLNQQLASVESQFRELFNSYPRILNFLSQANLSNYRKEQQFLKSTFRLFFNLIIEADYGSIYIIKNNKVKYIDTIGHNLSLLKKYDFNAKAFKTGSSGLEIIRGIDQRYYSLEKSPEHIEVMKQATENIEKTLVSQVKTKDKIICISLDIKKNSPIDFSEISKIKLQAFKNIIASYYQNIELNTLKSSLTTDIIKAFTNLLNIHDSYTTNHSHEVADYSLQIADRLSLDAASRKDLYYSSVLHDIGKVLIPREIINKKDKLSIGEFELIKKHPVIGYHATEDLESLSNVSLYIRHHHEFYNGEGYPDGLKGEKIPLISRIIAITDAYEAMTSNRPYREALTVEKAIHELHVCKGHQFDPLLVEVFIDILRKQEKR